MIQKMAAARIPDFGFGLFVLRPEEDRAAEDPQERVLKALVMRAVGRHSPFNKDFGGAAEANDRCSVANFLGCEPKQHQPVLTEWHTIIRVSDDLEEKPPVSARVLERIGRQTADRQTAEDEGPCAERD